MAVHFDEKVANTGFVIADTPEGNVLAEDIVEYAGGPSAASAAGADKSAGVNFVCVGNLPKWSGIRAYRRIFPSC